MCGMPDFSDEPEVISSISHLPMSATALPASIIIIISFSESLQWADQALECLTSAMHQQSSLPLLIDHTTVPVSVMVLPVSIIITFISVCRLISFSLSLSLLFSCPTLMSCLFVASTLSLAASSTAPYLFLWRNSCTWS